MKAARTGLGVLVLLLGAVFMGQGLGYIAGSFMTGSLRWFWIGLAMAAGALALIFGPALRARSRRSGGPADGDARD